MENIKFGTSEYYRNYEELEVLGEGCIGLVKALKNKITGEEFAVKKVMTSDEEIICNVIENI
jgi:calcium/calmodulin-dependent protein kinase I